MFTTLNYIASLLRVHVIMHEDSFFQGIMHSATKSESAFAYSTFFLTDSKESIYANFYFMLPEVHGFKLLRILHMFQMKLSLQ